MRKPVAALLLVVALAAPSQAHALTRGTHVEVFKRGLNQVVDMAYVPRSTTLFYTEKNTGAIRVIVSHKLLPRPCVTLDVVSDGERGALGLVLDPDYRTNHYLYVYFTKRAPLENRVTRFTVTNNRCTHAHPLITGIPSWPATTTAGSCSSSATGCS